MKSRSLFLIIALLLAMFVGAVSAQDEMPFDPCFGLSADDCAYINAANANGVGDATNFTLSMDVVFNASGIPGATPQDPTTGASFTLNGGLDLLESTNAMLPVNAGGVFNVTATDGNSPMELTLELRLVDGILYVLDPMSGEWQGIDLIAAMSDPTFLEQFGLDPSAPDLGLGAMTGMGNADIDMEALGSLADLINLPGLISYVRAGEIFTFTIDLTALSVLLTPEYEDQLNTIVDAASQIDPSAAMFIPMIPVLLKEGTITVTQTVNPELNIVETIGFSVNASVDTGMLSGTPEAEPVVITLNVTLSIGNFGGAVAPEAPADATMMDLNQGQ